MKMDVMLSDPVIPMLPLLADDEDFLLNSSFRRSRMFLSSSKLSETQLFNYFGLNAHELNDFENFLGPHLKRTTARSFAFSSRKIMLIGLNYMRKGLRFSDLALQNGNQKFL